MGLGLGLFSIGYWSLHTYQQQDWDYPSLTDRFDGSAWRFDNNQLILNYWLHPMAGAEMYALARANHHGPVASLGYSTLASFLWEFVFEYREFVSLNDLLATSFPGVPLGEFLHKFGLYLDAPHASGLARATQWAIAPGIPLDHRLDGRVAYRPKPRIWHDFEVSSQTHLGVLPNEPEYALFRAHFRGKLVSLPGYRSALGRSRSFYQIDFTQMEVGAEGSPHGAGLMMSARALLAGYHWQHLETRGRALSGNTSTLGASVAYSYLESHANGFPELFGAFHMPGAGFEFTAQSPLASVEVDGRLNPDFVGVGALDYEAWLAENPGELGKHILRNQGYFYGWGGSGQLDASARLGPLSFEGSMFFGRYRSQEGLNRWQERITRDAPAGTDLLRYRAAVAFSPPGLPLRIGFSAMLRRWDTFIETIKRQQDSLTRGLDVSFEF